MDSQTTGKLSQTLEKMALLEIEIAHFYEQCARNWESEAAFWMELAGQEVLHSERIGEIAALVASNPGDYRMGRRFTVTSVETFIQSVRNNTRILLDPYTTKKKALQMAHLIENSLLDKKFLSIVETENADFTRLAEEIGEETRKHAGRIQDRLATM